MRLRETNQKQKHTCNPSQGEAQLDLLFSCLSVRTCITLFACLLLERKVVLVSRQYSCLYHVCEALYSFMSPLEWVHVTILVHAGTYKYNRYEYTNDAAVNRTVPLDGTYYLTAKGTPVMRSLKTISSSVARNIACL